MSESAEVISNADASYGTDTETLPELEVTNPLEDAPQRKEKTDMIREAADNVQSCHVCYDEYHTTRNPARVLGCGHTFCTRCVINCSNPTDQPVTNSGIKCPECRKISEQAPATVPVNFQLMQILAALSLVKEPLSPEQDQDLLQYENFDRLGAHIPVNELNHLTTFEFYEHMKAVFNAIRVSARKEQPNVKQPVQIRIDGEIRKLDDVERNLHRHFQILERLKTGNDVNDAYFPFQWYMPGRDNNRRSFHDNDWMREMVVYRPPNDIPLLRDALSNEENPNPEPPQQDVEDVLAREQADGAEADPNRHLHLVREALLRRERESAQEREVAIRNERLMRQLVNADNEDDADLYERLRMLGLQHLTPYEREQRDLRNREIQWQRQVLEQNRQRESVRRVASGLPPILDNDDITLEEIDNRSDVSDDGSIIEEVVLPRPPEPAMTIGEAVTIYRMVEVFSPRSLSFRVDANSFVLPNNHPNLDSLYRELLPRNRTILDDLHDPQLLDLRRYCQANNVDCDRLLRNLRQHTVRFAPTLVETPRLTERRRRNRPILSDNYNAQLTLIRNRAKEALEGKRPERPIDDDEAELTVRLIVNLATSMGVRTKLDEIICPEHRIKKEETDLFERRTNSSTRQEMLFCTACRCEVPMGSKQVHTNGKRHAANIANRSQSRQQQH